MKIDKFLRSKFEQTVGCNFLARRELMKIWKDKTANNSFYDDRDDKTFLICTRERNVVNPIKNLKFELDFLNTLDVSMYDLSGETVGIYGPNEYLAMITMLLSEKWLGVILNPITMLRQDQSFSMQDLRILLSLKLYHKECYYESQKLVPEIFCQRYGVDIERFVFWKNLAYYLYSKAQDDGLGLGFDRPRNVCLNKDMIHYIDHLIAHIEYTQLEENKNGQEKI